MKKLVEGRRILVSGGGGSIGSELVRQISEFKPHSLLILDQSELALYRIDLELFTNHPDLDRKAIIADVRDSERIKQIHLFFMTLLKYSIACEISVFLFFGLNERICRIILKI